MDNTIRVLKDICSRIDEIYIIADDVCDYIPFLSTLTNIIDIIGKGVLKLISSYHKEIGVGLERSHYFKHLRDEKSLFFCIKLLIPFANIYFKFNNSNDAQDEFIINEPLRNPFYVDSDGMINSHKTETRTNSQIIDDKMNKIQESGDALIAKMKEDNIKKTEKKKIENSKKIEGLKKQCVDLPDGPLKESKIELAATMIKAIQASEENQLQIARSRGLDV